MIRLKEILDRTDVEYNEKVFNTTAGITGLGSNPFVSHNTGPDLLLAISIKIIH